MTNGTIYEYFRNKAEIFRFEFNRYFASFKEGMLEAVSSRAGPGERLQAVVDFALSHMEE